MDIPGFWIGYKSVKHVFVSSVGIWTTGYDCQDILNLAMVRPIFSPTDFIQIKGRGTRPWTFKYERKMGIKRMNSRLKKRTSNCLTFSPIVNILKKSLITMKLLPYLMKDLSLYQQKDLIYTKQAQKFLSLIL